MDLLILKTEIDADTLERDYSGMTDEDVAISLNTNIDRTTNKTSMSSSEIFNAINKTEFNALVVADKDLIWNLLALGTLDPFGLEATLFTDTFGGSSVTIATLQDLRKNDVSRGVELGLGQVSAGHVKEARLI